MPGQYKDHWEKIYSTKALEEVSWYQPYPKTSIEFLEYLNLPISANIIDIGGGDSLFVDALIEKGYRNIYVLDISSKAIDRAKMRLGKNALKIHWIVSDVIEFEPPVQFDFWHDRAAFHFLTTRDKIDKYVSIAEGAIKKDGHLILGTFSEMGPENCSGLEIKQYSEVSMTDVFAKSFQRVRCLNEDHHTPFHSEQNFLFCSFKKR